MYYRDTAAEAAECQVQTKKKWFLSIQIPSLLYTADVWYRRDSVYWTCGTSVNNYEVDARNRHNLDVCQAADCNCTIIYKLPCYHLLPSEGAIPDEAMDKGWLIDRGKHRMQKVFRMQIMKTCYAIVGYIEPVGDQRPRFRVLRVMLFNRVGRWPVSLQEKSNFCRIHTQIIPLLDATRSSQRLSSAAQFSNILETLRAHQDYGRNAFHLMILLYRFESFAIRDITSSHWIALC